MANPIWRDYVLSVSTTTTPYLYYIYCEGQLIYSGAAYKKPDASLVEIKLNEICADYLKQSIPLWNNDIFSDTGITKTFQIQGTGLNRSIDFTLDWSYGESKRMSSKYRSCPITPMLGVGHILLLTKDDATEVTLVKYAGEQVESETFVATPRASFNDDFNADFATTGSTATPQTLNIALGAEIGDVERVVVDDVFDFQMVKGKKYSLCYVNAFGGWDSFLPMGRVTQRDNYSRKGYQKEANNGSTYDRRNNVTFVNNIKKTFTIVTGWLTDDEASRMHHLLGSNDVHLYDAERCVMLPVTITTSECQYKTYGGEGNKLVNYTFDVELAERRERM